MSTALNAEARSPEVSLIAHGRTLPAERLGWLTPTDPAIGIDAIRARYEEHGYVWLKGLLPRDEVIDFRGWVFARLTETGLLEPGHDFSLGISAAEGVDWNLANRRLMSIVRSAAYEGFCAHPHLVRFMDAFLGGISYLHKRKLMRYVQPGTPVATPAHYDLVYLRGGTSRLVTAWIPVGDIPTEMGGLVYLEGSHALGRGMEAEFRARSGDLSPEERISAYNSHMAEGGWVSKDLPAMAERFDRRWLAADYEAGDVVLHSPYMIHASTTNQDRARRLRLSTDIRYQNVDDEIDARWSNHWSLGDML
ncbi:ectoine hydroxylase-related dioxygenase (phytanoyl-CoA dioxygenase family) [Rhizobium pisi]|uniref:Dehydrogenase n=1 Tax=Rhizobium pisi TaxID=574561 RepID=A0A3R9AY37_9HYPH|nr:phytanoyl-CoA dioxygenase family protein [Rhizobium pisi]MBB3138235.1 ectoine hydroxylase-related dioxygenase (phytanoyl-CoA dioxygenase family) [Rhizobium pisi]RSB63518.1 dehydrogenase [Rhizobium pisi]TCA40251.1 dehydrogenase [Rhizobium pisi]